MAKFAYFLNRVRYQTKSGTIITYRPGDIIEVGTGDNPPDGDPLYEKYSALGETVAEASEKADAMRRSGTV